MKPVNLPRYVHMGALPVYVGFVFSRTQWDGEMKRLKVPHPYAFMETRAQGGTVSARCTTLYPTDMKARHRMTTILISFDGETAFDNDRTGAAIAGLICHEAVHAVDSILESIGESQEAAGPEFRAYHVQWIVQCGLEFFREQFI